MAAKKLAEWLDEFVENGADPTDISDWGETAGGGGGAKHFGNLKLTLHCDVVLEYLIAHNYDVDAEVDMTGYDSGVIFGCFVPVKPYDTDGYPLRHFDILESCEIQYGSYDPYHYGYYFFGTQVGIPLPITEEEHSPSIRNMLTAQNTVVAYIPSEENEIGLEVINYTLFAKTGSNDQFSIYDLTQAEFDSMITIEEVEELPVLRP